MVRDGYFYAVPLIGAAVLIGWLTNVAWAILPLLLAAFFLWFFRDPERVIPQEPGAVVSPGDGTVTDVSPLTKDGERLTRISIFLSVFNVHVNRSPITGVRRGRRCMTRTGRRCCGSSGGVVSKAGSSPALRASSE
jgi:phosphatidylserine decarboxylase